MDINKNCEKELDNCMYGLKTIIKNELYDISDKNNLDINTVWIAFEQSVVELKEEIKKEY